MYAVPHFRYGALVYNHENKEPYRTGKDKEQVEREYNRLAKQVLVLPRNTS